MSSFHTTIKEVRKAIKNLAASPDIGSRWRVVLFLLWVILGLLDGGDGEDLKVQYA